MSRQPSQAGQKWLERAKRRRMNFLVARRCGWGEGPLVWVGTFMVWISCLYQGSTQVSFLACPVMGHRAKRLKSCMQSKIIIFRWSHTLHYRDWVLRMSNVWMGMPPIPLLLLQTELPSDTWCSSWSLTPLNQMLLFVLSVQVVPNYLCFSSPWTNGLICF